MTASDSEIIVVIFLHPAGCAVRASQRSSPCQSVGQRLAGATASPRLCARLVHSMVSVGPRFAYDSQEPVSLCVTLHRASLCSLTLRLQLTSVPCAHVVNPVVSVGQRLAGACSSASLCSPCPLGVIRAAIHRSQYLCVSAPCQTERSPPPKNCSNLQVVSGGTSSGFNIQAVSSAQRYQSRLTMPNRSSVAATTATCACAVPCRKCSEIPATGLVEHASRCAVPLVRLRGCYAVYVARTDEARKTKLSWPESLCAKSATSSSTLPYICLRARGAGAGGGRKGGGLSLNEPHASVKTPSLNCYVSVRVYGCVAH